MKETTQVVGSIDEAFAKWGEPRRSDHGKGRKYYKCPRCSADRRSHNRNARCVGVDIDDSGVRTYCNHCEDTNAFMLEGAVASMRAQASHRPIQGSGAGRSISERAAPAQNGYAALHRAGRAQWSRR